MQLAGRETELRSLSTIGKLSATERGQFVLVAGEAGIGKSALLEAFVRDFRETKKVLWGYCDDLVTPRPFGPIFDLALGLGQKVSALMRDGAPGSDLFPEILSAMSLMPAGSILIIEDLHWGDQATIELLRYLARRLVTLRVMIVLTFRDDEINADEGPGLFLSSLPSNLTSRLDLAPLSAADVAVLATQKGVPADGLFEATGGNPFFLSEVLAQPSPVGSNLPSSVRDAVVRRLGRLELHQRNFLEVLSVVPEPVSLELVRAMFGACMGDVCTQCIEKGQLVVLADKRVRFRHELARLCTLSTLSLEKQRSHHKRYLDHHDLAGGTLSLGLVVHHAHAIGDSGRVLEAVPLAARAAARLGAHHEAAAFLAIARDYLAKASPEQAAQIHEDWAYEAGLVLQMGDDVLAARHQAIKLWRQLKRLDKVGLNLRWLWRLHWYRGEMDQAKIAADQAIATLESIAPSKELGMAYSMRSQVYFLNSVNDQAIYWGEKALEIAELFDDVETRVHAMTNIATTRLLTGDHLARPMMELALAIALANDLHEHAARVYTNYAEYAILVRDWALAERILTEGLAFDAKHNLRSWTYYLVGRQAQMHLDQGRLEEASLIARGALSIDRLTAVMRFPAMIALAVAQSRLGGIEALGLLEQSLTLALELKEPQNIIPARFGLIEHFALTNDIAAAQGQLADLIQETPDCFSPWDRAQVGIWGRRLGVRIPGSFDCVASAAQAFELSGDWLQSMSSHESVGTPMEPVFVALFVPPERANPAFVRAIAICEQIGSNAGGAAIRNRAEALGIAHVLPRTKRGPYNAVKNHPLGLSAKEVEVLSLMVEGANNPEIAATVNRSRRTIEHHVSAILGKMGVTNRLEAILRTLSEPWIINGQSPKIR
jgi:DNA-binding CsgD family transcriptional regulator/tetratricopeptide (TPR) repeat protein